jgi:PAS domain S-box-containing protein
MKQSNGEDPRISSPDFFNDLPIALFRSRPDGTFLTVNKAFRELTGYVNDAGLQILHASDLYVDLDERQKKLTQLFGEGFLHNEQLVLRRYDGSIIKTYLDVNLVCNEDGEAQYFEGAIQEVDDEQWSNDQLQYRLAVEQLVLEITSSVIAADPGQLVRVIKDALPRIGQHAGLDVVHLVVYESSGKAATLSLKWRSDQSGGILEKVDVLSFGAYTWAVDRLETSEMVVKVKLAEMPVETTNERAYLEAEGVQSLMVAPIDVDEGYSGYLILGAISSERVWDDWDVHLVRRLGIVFFRALAHEHAVQALEESEQRYRQLFVDSPVAMWEQDFTELKNHLDSLQKEGITDIRTYFENDPQEALRCMGMITSGKYNRSMVELLYTKKIEDLETIRMEELSISVPSKGYVDELVAVAEGRQFYESEVMFTVSNNVQKHVYIRWTVSPDLAEPYRRVIVTGMDISKRKQLEEQTRRRLALETLVAQISADLIDVGYEEIDDAILYVLEEVGEFMGDDRVFLDLIQIPGWAQRPGFEWRREGLPIYEGNIQDRMKKFTWLQGEVDGMQSVHIPSAASGLPPEAAPEKEWWLSVGCKSVLLIPLSMHNRFAGLLGCDTEFHEKEWSDEDIRMLRLIGEALVSVLVRKQAENALQRRIEAEELVSQISTRFIDLPLSEIDEQIEASLIEVAKFMGGDRVFIDLLAEDKLLYTHIYEWFTVDQQKYALQSKHADLRNYPWMKNELENMHTINISSIANGLPPEAAAVQEMWQAENRKSILLIPFSINNRFAGVLGCSTKGEEKTWPNEDVNILQLASDIYASVLVRKNTERALQERDLILNRQVEELKVLNAVAAVGAAATDEQVLIEKISKLVIETLYPANFLVLLMNEATELLEGRVYMHTDDAYVSVDIGGVPLESGVISSVVSTNRARRFADIRRSPEAPMVDAKTRSLLCVPMAAGGRIIGIVNVESEAASAFTEGDERFLNNLAGQMATAVTRVRFLNAEHSRRMEMEDLVNFTRSLRNVETIPEIEKVLVEMPASLFDADNSALLLPKGRCLIVVAAAGQVVGTIVGKKYPYEENSSPLWHIAQAGTPLYLDLRQSAVRQAIPELFENSAHAIVLPLKTSNQVHGLLCLGFSNPMRAFTSIDQNLVDAISDVAGNALYSAQIMETLEQRVRDRTQMLYIVYETVSILNRTIPLPEMLRLVLDGMMDVVGGSSGAIHLINDVTRTLDLTAERHMLVEVKNDLKIIPTKDQSWDWHQWLVDPEAPHVVTDLPVKLDFPEVLRLDGFLTYIGLPIFIQNEPVGFISLFGHSAENIRPDSLELLRALSDQIAYAIEKNRLQEFVALNAVVKERQRLASDLHDSVLQSLYSVNLMAKAAHTFAGNDQWERSRHYLKELGDTMQKALKEMRLLIYELRPSALETEGLEGALRRKLKGVEGRIGARTELVGSAQIDIPRHIEESLYQVAVEALNNVVKHSEATFVSIYMSLSDGKACMDISDNGIGFVRASGVGKGIGLSIMSERAREINGQLDVLSTPKEGTTIRVTVEL